MKALGIYVVLVVIGMGLSFGISWFVETRISKSASLIVFIVSYFGNFGLCWMLVRLIMDGHLRDESAPAASAPAKA